MKKILSALGVATLVIMGVASANTMVSGEANTHRCTTGYTWSDQAEGCIKAGASGTMTVGGDKDDYGCYIGAGYTWSQTHKACLRSWEETGASDFDLAYDFAFNFGMTTMDTHTKFRANDNVSRQEAAKILAVMAQRAFGKMPTVSCDVTYKDEASFDSTLQASIYASCSLGLMKGSNGRFMPNATLTRGQAIAILMRNADQWLDETDSKDRWQPYVHRARALGYLSFDSTANFNAAITRHELIEWAHSIYLRSSVDN